MGIQLLKLLMFKMAIPKFRGFMKDYNLKDDTLNESDSEKFVDIQSIVEIQK